MIPESQVKQFLEEMAKQLKMSSYVLVYLDDGQKAKVTGNIQLADLTPVLMEAFLKKVVK